MSRSKNNQVLAGNAFRKGMITSGTKDSIIGIIDSLGLASRGIDIKPGDVIEHMKYDKKNFQGKINFILLEGLFRPLYNQQVDEEYLVPSLDQYL